MSAERKRLTEFIRSLGAEEVAHTQRNYLAHLANVWGLMESRGCSEELCKAGLFHSIYGTESFQAFQLPLSRRAELAAMIGERAERLAYLNCAMDRGSFDAAVLRTEPPHCFTDRMTGEMVELSTADFDDLCRIHLYDWLEQVARSQKWGWGYRRAAYRAMADRLGSVAQAAYAETFAQEPAAS